MRGKGVSGGVAVGKIHIHRSLGEFAMPQAEKPRAVGEELALFEKARKETDAALEKLELAARSELGEGDADIFAVHRMLLGDADFTEPILRSINSGMSASLAVWQTAKELSDGFEALDDEYMSARAADLRDVASRLIADMTGNRPGSDPKIPDKPYILCAADITPGETMTLDKSKIIAIVTERGTYGSHSAILARARKIPAIVGVEGLVGSVFEGESAIADGDSGELTLSPAESETAAALERTEREKENERRYATVLSLPTETADGRKLLLCANIGTPDGLEEALAVNADGIGLFRSEFLFMGKDRQPTEDEQFEAYRSVLAGMHGRPVVIRTLDAGADKQIPFLGLGHEENPALGYRGIRVCLDRRELFLRQLRALCRASAYGRLSVLFPMITSEKEFLLAKEAVEEAKRELAAEKLPFAESIPLGVMIETPAAAIISDRLAVLADFFSVGTNDLTQYTLACDRQNPKAEPFLDTHHEALLRMIKYAADCAHREKKTIGICGELAADLSLTEFFIDIGIDELSMSASNIPKTKYKIVNTDMRKAAHAFGAVADAKKL